MTDAQPGTLNLYAVFHLNLAFSSIPSSHYSLILDRCYWPLLDLAIRMQIPFGFEATGYTLELLNEIDPSFIQTLKAHWAQDNIEFIGSGYTQSIMPLMPMVANRQNLKIGNQVYEDLLGRKPVTAYINEQTWSDGLVDLYLEAGYQNIFMEWNNPAKFNHYPSYTRYAPQQLAGMAEEGSLTVVWNDSIAFQKLQRTLNQTLPQSEYFEFLAKHLAPGESRGLAFYGSDAEIIDYHPGQLEAQYLSSPNAPDLQRLIKILEHIQSQPQIFQWTTPGAFAKKRHPSSHSILLGSPEYPLPCKKQPKYNPTRWAISGREDVSLNTSCYANTLKLETLAAMNTSFDQTVLWRYLLEQWSSDFRTYTTDEKLGKLRQISAHLSHELSKALPIINSNNEREFTLFNPNPNVYEDILILEIQLPHGALHGYPILQNHPACYQYQVETLEHYQDGSIRQFKAVLDIHLPAQTQTQFTWESTDHPTYVSEERLFKIFEENDRINIVTNAINITLLKSKGGAIYHLQFPQLSDRPWAGTIPHGTFDDIALGADFFSGHFILNAKNGQKATDLSAGNFQLPDKNKSYPIRIPIQVGVQTPMGNVWKTLYIYQNQPRIDLLYHFRFQDVGASSCRVGICTILPDAFDPETVAYRTVNGGISSERFPLKGHTVTHDDPVSIAVSAQHGLGATEGWVAVEDQENRLVLKTYPQNAYAMPMVHYQESQPGYFLRILPSIGEFDDTSHTLRRGHQQIMFTWLGQKAKNTMQSFLPIYSMSENVKILPV